MADNGDTTVKDYMYLAMAKQHGVRGYAAATTHLVEEARLIHQTTPTATIALGRALTAVALMSGLLKVGQRVALKWEGNGPLRKIVVEAESNGRVRGYVGEAKVDATRSGGEANLVDVIGRAGLLTVVRDLQLPELAQGAVHLAASDIDHDLVYFLEQSDQVPSAVETGVALADDGSVLAAGGLLIQPFPPYEPENVERLKERLQEMPPVSALIGQGLKPEAILDQTFADFPHTLISKYPLRFECNCSRERTYAALATLGREELEQILATEGEAVVDCHYCRKQYVFSREDIEALLEEL